MQNFDENIAVPDGFMQQNDEKMIPLLKSWVLGHVHPLRGSFFTKKYLLLKSWVLGHVHP